MRSGVRWRGSIQPGVDGRTDGQTAAATAETSPGTGRLRPPCKATRMVPEGATRGRGRETQARQRGARPPIDREHKEVIRVPLRRLFSCHGESAFHS